LVENIGFRYNTPPMIGWSIGGRVHWNSNAKKQGDGWEIVHETSNNHTGIKMRENAFAYNTEECGFS
jgi:hypothetical protein